MAAPTPSTRQDPTGVKLGDGYRTLISISADRDINFWEKTVTPPALEGDDFHDTTTMHNTQWRTKHPRTLVTLGDLTMTAAYDPIVYNEISAIINVNTTITVHFPDHSSLAFYGAVRVFTPDALEEGNQPMATITIVPTNEDPTDCSEEGPVYTAGPGTAPC